MSRCSTPSKPREWSHVSMNDVKFELYKRAVVITRGSWDVAMAATLLFPAFEPRCDVHRIVDGFERQFRRRFDRSPRATPRWN